METHIPPSPSSHRRRKYSRSNNRWEHGKRVKCSLQQRHARTTSLHTWHGADDITITTHHSQRNVARFLEPSLSTTVPTPNSLATFQRLSGTPPAPSTDRCLNAWHALGPVYTADDGPPGTARISYILVITDWPTIVHASGSASGTPKT